MITPSQTVGPFFALGMPCPDAVPDGVWLRGRVLDGAADPVPDALVETWQCDGDGRFDNPGFRGLGRCATDADGRYRIRTVKPATPDGEQAPHVDVSVFGEYRFSDTFGLNATFLYDRAIGKGPNQSAKCFIPRHALRVTKDGETVDVVICFECVLVKKCPSTASSSTAKRRSTSRWSLGSRCRFSVVPATG